jgi:23S rRNA (guanosine2251-2'-O)-methyltransferase
MDREDILEGKNHVFEAIKADREINNIFIVKGSNDKAIRRILSAARGKNIIIREVDKRKLDNISETGFHQGIIAMASPKKYVEVEDILEIAKLKNEPPFILILDEVEDEYNFGSLIRTSVAAGVHGIIIPKRRAAPLSSRAGKASAGAIEHIEFARVNNITQTIKILKEQNIWVYGLEADGSKSIYKNDFSGGIAIVLGSEGNGLSKLVRDNCDDILSIPMKNIITSLSVSVAGAIAVFEAYKNRRKN